MKSQILKKQLSAALFVVATGFAGIASADTTTTTEVVPQVNGGCRVSSSSSSSGNSYTSVSVSAVRNADGTCTITTTRTTGTSDNGGSTSSPPGFINPNSPICRFFAFSFCKG